MEAIASRIDLEKKATDGSSRLIIRRLGFVRQREYGRLMAESIIPTMPNQVVAARAKLAPSAHHSKRSAEADPKFLCKEQCALGTVNGNRTNEVY